MYICMSNDIYIYVYMYTNIYCSSDKHKTNRKESASKDIYFPTLNKQERKQQTTKTKNQESPRPPPGRARGNRGDRPGHPRVNPGQPRSRAPLRLFLVLVDIYQTVFLHAVQEIKQIYTYISLS